MATTKNPLRVIIENVQPEIEEGKFAAKRILGDTVHIEADIFADGHDELSAELLHRKSDSTIWTKVPMQLLGNDRWRGEFTVSELGVYRFTVRGWVDAFKSWRRDFRKRLQAGQNVTVEMRVGTRLIAEAAQRAKPDDSGKLSALLKNFERLDNHDQQCHFLLGEEIYQLVASNPALEQATNYSRELSIRVDREKARYSAWYELFPRSCSSEPGRHGTFRDVIARLPYIAGLGFDVLYLPPIHPIGMQYRKGKNNAVNANVDDVGSPWGIGGAEGGHKAIHPELGTLDDFRQLVKQANEQGVEIALDIAFQASPDHPWVKEHPEWFKKRPDGTIQYAENPPKKYQDIYPIHFESEKWSELWDELKSVFLYWIQQGVKIFRVDNPHTKSINFWEWCIDEIKRDHPDVIFLSEAFTRPRIMYRLAKIGFSQSYTYFSWRNAKHELTQYVTELTTSSVKEYFRPNFWPNTPDILTEYLQHGGRGAFMARLVLAATLASNYGIYGPAFELCIHRPREHGSEEYLDSEKYEIKRWNWNDSESLYDIIAQVNAIRRTNPALHGNDSLRFHPINNDQLICYSKTTADMSNIIIVIVNLDPYHTQSGWVELPLEQLGLDANQPYQLHDVLGQARFLWYGGRNYVELNPHVVPAHIFRVRRRVRSERDFEYYL